MADNTQTIYEATYNAVRDALLKAGATSEPIQNAAREWFTRNAADLQSSIMDASAEQFADRCAERLEEFLEENRDAIIEAIATKAATKGGDE